MGTLKNIKNILYIHGYNSSGSTGKLLNELFKKHYGDDVMVYAPSVSPIYSEARKTIDDFLKTHKVDLIIGTSLGGFMTLDTPGYFRISVNPTLMPMETLPFVDATSEQYNSYELAELSLTSKVDSEDKVEVYGLFGSEDKVVDFKDEFSRVWSTKNMFFAPGMEHQMKEKDIEKYLFTVVETVDRAKGEYAEYIFNKDKYELD